MDRKELRELLGKATPGLWEAQIPAMTGVWPHAKIKPLKIRESSTDSHLLK